MKREFISHIFKTKPFGKELTVAGWVRTRRDSKAGFSFIEVNDGTCLRNIQVIAEKSLPNYKTDVLRLSPGSSVIVKGIVVESPGKGQELELRAQQVKVLGLAEPSLYPLQKKRHSFEFLRTIAHLRPRTNTFGAVARVRNRLSMAVHYFFQKRGFIYIHTPILTGSDCEGAGQLFRVTSLDLENLPFKDNKVDYSQDFFGVPTNLTVSGQLEAEVYALAMGNVYTFGPTFRAENSNTTRHLAEFWMVEPEMAFCDLNDNISIAIEFLKYLVEDALKNCEEDLNFFNKFIKQGLIEELKEIVNKEFRVISYTEAIESLSRSWEDFQYPVAWGSDLQSEHERYLCEKAFNGPVVVYNYPKEIKPFYMKLNGDKVTVRAMDILFKGVGEVVGGSQREDDYNILIQRMKESGLTPDDYWWYLDLRRFGSVPHSGFGLGFDRFVQFVTGLNNIRDVIPFPRTPGNIGF